MEWLKKIMAGRYGNDQLSLAMLILSVILMLISRLFSGLWVLVPISYIPLLLSIFRNFSKDISRRRMENYKFMMLISPLYSRGLKALKKIEDRRRHKYLNCPNCNTKLRLPRGKGKICVTCPKCKTQFMKKT